MDIWTSNLLDHHVLASATLSCKLDKQNIIRYYIDIRRKRKELHENDTKLEIHTQVISFNINFIFAQIGSEY